MAAVMDTRTCWPYFDPEYDTIDARMNPPRVVVDNKAHDHVTVIKVDSANTDGALLDVVQILTELDFCIPKAYISSDGVWFMDVFHVTNSKGAKILDDDVTDRIQAHLDDKCKQRSSGYSRSSERCVGVQSSPKYTIIELTGTDRPGLLSEISASLTSQGCNVDAAEVWTHNLRVACVVYVTDQLSRGPIQDQQKLASIKDCLSGIMHDDGDKRSRTDFAVEETHSERRLHQLMYADRDYEFVDTDAASHGEDVNRADTEVQVRNEKGYSVVNVTCKDRPKLLFDTVCTLTDMDYVVFHATIDSEDGEAVQEYYIRRKNGEMLDAEAEKKVIKCLKAAIERRVSTGLRLELCTNDRVGLLSEITRIFMANGLSVARADVATQNDQAVNVFYVIDATGCPVDMKIVESIRKSIGQAMLKVAEVPSRFVKSPPREEAKPKFSLGNLLKSPLFYNLGLIKPSYA